jgi:hypothetical protein
VRWLHTYLHEAADRYTDVRLLVAPYRAAAQMAQLAEDELVDGVAGPASCLLYGAYNVILDFDWTVKHVHWVGAEQCESLPKGNQSLGYQTVLPIN